MARGWGVDPAEVQAGLTEKPHRPISQDAPDPVALELIRKKESLLLSRTRVITELNSAQNPRYKVLLSKALADLDAQLTTL
jgi:hypothetical protein